MTVIVKTVGGFDDKIALIQKICCEEFKVYLIDLLSERRHREYAIARHIAFWICRRQTLASYPVIGRMFRRDHSTIICGERKAEKLIATDEEIKVTAYKCLERFKRETKENTCTS